MGFWGQFTDEFTMLTDVFKITRTKNSIMQGSGVELVELNNIWLAKDYGMLKMKWSLDLTTR